MLDGLCCDDFYSLCIGTEQVCEFVSYDPHGNPFTAIYGLDSGRVSWVTDCPKHPIGVVDFLNFRFHVRYFHGE